MGTIADLNELTAPATNDFWVVRDVSDPADKDKKVMLGKFPLKDGTPVAGRMARWKDANTLEDSGKVLEANVTGAGSIVTNGKTLTVVENSSLKGTLDGNVSGGGTISLGGFTFTIPATGVGVLTNAAQTLGNKTINTIGLTYQTMAVNALVGLSVWTAANNGMFLVHNATNATICVFLVRAGANTVVEVGFDNTNAYSHTANTANSINFYYDSTYGYVLQNKLSIPSYIGVFAVGA